MNVHLRDEGPQGDARREGLAVDAAVDPVELRRPLGDGDVGRLTAIHGIGRKSAERLGLDFVYRYLGDEPLAGLLRPVLGSPPTATENDSPNEQSTAT